VGGQNECTFLNPLTHWVKAGHLCSSQSHGRSGERELVRQNQTSFSWRSIERGEAKCHASASKKSREQVVRTLARARPPSACAPDSPPTCTATSTMQHALNQRYAKGCSFCSSGVVQPGRVQRYASQVQRALQARTEGGRGSPPQLTEAAR